MITYINILPSHIRISWGTPFYCLSPFLNALFISVNQLLVTNLLQIWIDSSGINYIFSLPQFLISFLEISSCSCWMLITLVYIFVFIFSKGPFVWPDMSRRELYVQGDHLSGVWLWFLLLGLNTHRLYNLVKSGIYSTMRGSGVINTITINSWDYLILRDYVSVRCQSCQTKGP